MSLGDEERERDEAEDDLEDALPPPAPPLPPPPRASLLFLRSLLLLRERLEDDRDDDLRFHNDLIIKLCRFSHTLAGSFIHRRLTTLFLGVVVPLIL